MKHIPHKYHWAHFDPWANNITQRESILGYWPLGGRKEESLLEKNGNGLIAFNVSPQPQVAPNSSLFNVLPPGGDSGCVH